MNFISGIMTTSPHDTIHTVIPTNIPTTTDQSSNTSYITEETKNYLGPPINYYDFLLSINQGYI